MSKKDSLNFLKPQSKQDHNLNFLKIQNCVLKVNVHCEGCKKKVQKILQKIDGVYTVSVDAEHGKVTVSSSVDPYTLIKKLGKAGKHAELLSPKGTINAINNSNKNNKKSNGSNLDFLNDQLKKLKLDGWKGGGGQEQEKKKDNGKPKKGLITGGLKDEIKGEHNMLKDLKLPQTQLKGALSFPAQKDQQKNVKFSLPHDFDDGSDFDDLDDDDDDDELYDDYDDSELDDLDDDIYEDRSVGSNKGSAKKGSDGAKDGKNGDKNNNKNTNNNKGSEKNQGLAMGNNNNHHQQQQQQHKMMGPIGHQAGMATAAINPYQQQQQQQYMQQLMRQQQQQQMMMMNGPTVYGQPMGYIPAAGPPVYGEPYGNYFSDDNTNNCSIM